MTVNIEYNASQDAYIVSSDRYVSDGYHTFKELYEHRNMLFLSLIQTRLDVCWWSEKHHDGTGYDGYIIVGMELPSGSITYHLENKYSTLLRMMGVDYIAVAPKWDGHTSKDVLNRLNQAILYDCKNA